MAYPLDITGVKLYELKGAYAKRLVLMPDADMQTICRLVDGLPLNMWFSFYDRDHPSPSDPGAYVCFEKDVNHFKVSRGNHGWTSGDFILSRAELLDYFWRCNDFNRGHYHDETMSWYERV
jgi:hypothetical protein